MTSVGIGKIHLITIAILLCSAITKVWAQDTASLEDAKQNAYQSKVDSDLTIRRVALLPVSDNLDGIYAHPIEAELKSLIKDDRQWDFVESNVDQMPALDDLETNSLAFSRLTGGTDADAFIAATAIKNQAGISIRMDLFLRSDNRLLAQVEIKNRPRTDLADVKDQVHSMFRNLTAKIPYQGMILSRQQNRVTINLGKADGLVADQTLNVVQILKVTRHPKFSFLISTEKEIIGKVRVVKVDEGLSFGTIVLENERGAIKKSAKIAGLDPVVYNDTNDLSSAAGVAGPEQRPDSEVSFGKGAKEWLPTRPPSFGEVGIMLGAGQYSTSVNITGVQTLSGSSNLYPQLNLFGELWLNPNWMARAEIEQGVIQLANPRSGSTPANLNESISKYSLIFGYNFLLHDDFFGPKFQISAGYSSFKVFVDDSQPTALTSTTYSGLTLGLLGEMPINEQKIWFIGAKGNLVLLPSLAESPVSSGASSTNTVVDFSFFAEKKLGENLRAIGALDFSIYSSSLSGTGSRINSGTGSPETVSTISQTFTSLNAGIAYLF